LPCRFYPLLGNHELAVRINYHPATTNSRVSRVDPRLVDQACFTQRFPKAARPKARAVSSDQRLFTTFDRLGKRIITTPRLLSARRPEARFLGDLAGGAKVKVVQGGLVGY